MIKWKISNVEVAVVLCVHPEKVLPDFNKKSEFSSLFTLTFCRSSARFQRPSRRPLLGALKSPKGGPKQVC